jgi:hypothetical protein
VIGLGATALLFGRPVNARQRYQNETPVAQPRPLVSARGHHAEIAFPQCPDSAAPVPGDTEPELWLSTLLDKIADPDPNTREFAHKALVRIGQPAVPALRLRATGNLASVSANAANKILAAIEGTSGSTTPNTPRVRAQ